MLELTTSTPSFRPHRTYLKQREDEREFSRMTVTALYNNPTSPDHLENGMISRENTNTRTHSISYQPPLQPPQRQLPEMSHSMQDGVLSPSNSIQKRNKKKKKRTQSDGDHLIGGGSRGKELRKGIQTRKLSALIGGDTESGTNDLERIPSVQRYDDAAKMFAVEHSDYSYDDGYAPDAVM